MNDHADLNIGQLIREYRTNQRMTQTEFGRMLSPEITYSGVSRWERSIEFPPQKYASQIMSILKLNSEDYFERNKQFLKMKYERKD